MVLQQRRGGGHRVVMTMDAFIRCVTAFSSASCPRTSWRWCGERRGRYRPARKTRWRKGRGVGHSGWKRERGGGGMLVEGRLGWFSVSAASPAPPL